MVKVYEKSVPVKPAINIILMVTQLEIWWKIFQPLMLMFFDIGVLKNLAIFTGRHMYWSICINQFAGLKDLNFVTKRLQHNSVFL